MQPKLERKIMRVLVVASHPDDEILMAGGTMARLSQKGHLLRTLILGKGRENSSQYKGVERANKIVGCYLTSVLDFPDNKFDSVPLLEITRIHSEITSVRCWT